MAQLPPSKRFPDAERADDLGLVCVGGQLDSRWLLDAYRHGLFPWPLIDGIDQPQWWSPNPRAIFELDDFHVSRRLTQTIRSGKFQATSDRD
ncbi:MAG TPA: leucyl/phenylalanyl-tRNA--protein transferase, partial [Pirellulales bacterium]